MAGLARATILLLALALSSAGPGRAAKRPQAFTGELRLDRSDPVIEVEIGDVRMRLRVALDQKRLIELNPEAAARLSARPPDRHFRFESGFDAQVGRETLRGMQAAAPIGINGRRMLVTVATHGRPCCAGVDGEIGLGLLPYATIRFGGSETEALERTAIFLIEDDSERGPQARVAAGSESIFIQFSLDRPESVATASAGAMLARLHGGRLSERGTIVAAFGVERPVSALRFPRPVSIAGFPFDELAVRTADFGGRLGFPADPDAPEDIVVARKVTPQSAWPVVLIGRDRLDRCGEVLFDGNRHVLTLRCAAEAGL